MKTGNYHIMNNTFTTLCQEFAYTLSYNTNTVHERNTIVQ